MKFLILLFVFLTFGTNDIQQPVASYDIKPELFWLEENKYGFVPLEESYYATVYYEPVAKKYYFATIKQTNNISYNTNNIQDEKQYIDYEKYGKVQLTYIGSINLTNRVYIDTNGNQYIKQLEVIGDLVYIDYSTGKELPLTYPIYPYVNYDDFCGNTVRYSNSNNYMQFYRNVFAPENEEAEARLKAPLREYRDPSYY